MLKDEFRCLTKMHSVSVTDLNAQAKTTKILQRELKFQDLGSGKEISDIKPKANSINMHVYIFTYIHIYTCKVIIYHM